MLTSDRFTSKLAALVLGPFASEHEAFLGFVKRVCLVFDESS